MQNFKPPTKKRGEEAEKGCTRLAKLADTYAVLLGK